MSKANKDADEFQEGFRDLMRDIVPMGRIEDAVYMQGVTLAAAVNNAVWMAVDGASPVSIEGGGFRVTIERVEQQEDDNT